MKAAHASTDISTDALIFSKDVPKLAHSTDFMNDLPAAIYTCDRNGKISFFNQAAVDLWGRIPEIGKDMWCGSWKSYNFDGTTLEPDSCSMAVVIKEGHAVNGVEVILEHGNIIGFSKVTRDLTEQKLAEDKLLLSSKEIAFRNIQLEEFACITSHDLQEPLRKIQTYSSMLENQIDSKSIALNTIGKINAAAKRMSGLIQDILHYSEISISKSAFEMTDLKELLDNIRIDYELLIAEKKVQLIYNNMPSVYGIPVQLQQLFFNLIGNAIKFSSDNPVIEITSENASKKEIAKIKALNPAISYIKITVKDNGIGFDCKYADKIFKLFQRLQTDQPGSGIGLSLCKKIIENHKGHIAVQSEINKGSAFTLFFPNRN